MLSVRLKFSGEVWFWRGPSPFHFVTVPESESREIGDVSKLLTYGWGVIPVSASTGETDWTTSLIPKDGRYLVPLKKAVRVREDITIGDVVEVNLILDIRH
jgi:hypothetical protein